MKPFIFSFFIVASFQSIMAQAYRIPSNELKLGFGFADNYGEQEIGSGFVFFLGYHKYIDRKQKVSIGSNIGLGNFSTREYTGMHNMHYNSYNFNLNIEYKFLRIKAFAISVSGGGFVAMSSGLIGASGQTSRRETYFREYYAGYTLAAALHFSPPNSNFSFNITPITVYSNILSFDQFQTTLGVGYRF